MTRPKMYVFLPSQLTDCITFAPRYHPTAHGRASFRMRCGAHTVHLCMCARKARGRDDEVNFFAHCILWDTHLHSHTRVFVAHRITGVGTPQELRK
jgi:hypothetical protein